MEFTFLKATGEVAFFREDAEQAEWTQHDMTLLCSFPFLANKTIERGMTVLFVDPATGEWKAYEIRNCTLYEEQGYQQFTAEDICISELTDIHITDRIEFSGITAAAALSQVLIGTGWNVGNVDDSGVSFGDIERGSVWDAVNTIKSNWNIHIISRVTVSAVGIVGKYLDILPAVGTWRGMRLAIDKNLVDPSVTYDDSELYTALYGYGATYSDGEGDSRQTKETTFAGVTWAKTEAHPAKPAGQIYLEDAEKTALYGRNGKPRFNYYQNGEIEDPEILLEKTWEVLKRISEPKISITGTAADLKRLGYNDTPMRLHDMVIVDLFPLDVQFYKQIIQLTVNLLDPTGNTPVIGDYIPNIIYINRDTEDYATGGSKSVGGSRGGRGGTRSSRQRGEFETNIQQNERNIILNARQINTHGDILRQAGMSIDPVTGVLIYAEDNVNNIGSKFRVQAGMISTEVTARKEGETLLSSRITQTANRITLEVNERQAGEAALSSKISITASQIRSEVSNSVDGLDSKITQTANQIRSEVSNSVNGLDSKITQTATQIRSEVSNSVDGLSSRITQNADKVSIVVDDSNNLKTASIVAGINGQSGSFVKISADKINLSGYVTASALESTNAKISNLMSGNTTASKIVTDDLRLPSAFYYHGNRYTEFYSSTEKKYLLGRS